jgi:polar amino acid transport system substrate-binding protein
MSPTVLWRTCAAALAVSTAAALTSCGSSSSSSATGGTSDSASQPWSKLKVDPKIKAEFPEKVQQAGSLNVAADASYAPDEFFGTDNKTIIGMGADLAHALSAITGIDFNMTNSTFDAIIPGIQAGRFDAAISSMTDLKEREAKVDFVDYFNAGTIFMVNSSGDLDISKLDQLCGLTVATERGTTEQIDATNQSKACTDAGKKAVNVLTFPDQNEVNLALSTGRADVVTADSPVGAYQVQLSKGKFKVTGEYGIAPYGIALPKNSGMVQPLESALTALIADGVYGKILDKWSLQKGAIQAPALNGAVS